jgi:hypothetical protein
MVIGSLDLGRIDGQDDDERECGAAVGGFLLRCKGWMQVS